MRRQGTDHDGPVGDSGHDPQDALLLSPLFPNEYQIMVGRIDDTQDLAGEEIVESCLANV